MGEPSVGGPEHGGHAAVERAALPDPGASALGGANAGAMGASMAAQGAPTDAAAMPV